MLFRSQTNCDLNSTANILIVGDSIISGLSRYPAVWFKYFGKESALNLGVADDRTQHVLWRISNIELPQIGRASCRERV